MQKDGKYVYCIIASDCESNFDCAGVGGDDDLVTTIGFQGLSMVVSSHPLNKLAVTPENILAHQRVIEEVMKDHSRVIPVKFGTIAATPDEIRNLLDRKYTEFSEILNCFENKVELNIRGTWKDMPDIYEEINSENADLQSMKKRINKLAESDKKNDEIVKTGMLVEKALMQKKEDEAETICDMFRRIYIEFRQNKTSTDSMFMNTAFLVNSGREVEIDNIMSDIGTQFKNRYDFVYTFPLPVFNFVNLVIIPETWEM
ncbi:MAG: GvpL/GvpF family gas vesicle protein [Ignavibacteriota bacterium]|nr:GvpL/GvpF family gas vesicle protein [Ignavibacteriota bacterium]